MQKKSLSLQVFRTIPLIFLCLLAFNAPAHAQPFNQPAQNALLKGHVAGFKFLSAPKKITNITFVNAASQPVSLSSFRGKLVLLTLCATWCPYCARELPTLDEAQDMLGKEKFVVLAISVDKEGPTIVKKYLQEKSLNLPAYADPRDTISKMMGTRGVPYSFLIDQEGNEIGRMGGDTDWSTPEAIELLRAFIR